MKDALKKISTLRVVATILISMNTLRFLGGTDRTLAVLKGTLPTSYYVPGIGDMLAGALAPFIAYILWRNVNKNAQKIVLAWNIYGFIDLVIAIIIVGSNPAGNSEFVTPQLAFTFMGIHLFLFFVISKLKVKVLVH